MSVNEEFIGKLYLEERINDDENAIAAKMLLYANPSPSADKDGNSQVISEYQSALQNNTEFPVFPEEKTNHVNILDRVKHAANNMLTLYDLTYLTQAKIHLLESGRDLKNEDSTYLDSNGEYVNLSRIDSTLIPSQKDGGIKQLAKNLGWHKVSKTDFSHLRSVLKKQLVEQLPRLHQTLIEMKNVGGVTFSYSTNDVKLYKMSRNFVYKSLREVLRIISEDSVSENEGNVLYGYRSFIEEKYLKTKDKTKRSDAKLPPYTEKLISNLIAKMVKTYNEYNAAIAKDSKLGLDSTDLQNGRSEYVENVDAILSGGLGFATSFTNLSQKNMYDILSDVFMYNYDSGDRTDSTESKKLIIIAELYKLAKAIDADPSMCRFQILKDIVNGKYVYDKVSLKQFEDNISVICDSDGCVGSNRLITSFFKVFTTDKSKNSANPRKPLPDVIEDLLLNDDYYHAKLPFAPSVSKKTGKVEHFLIISDRAYNNIQDPNFKSSFNDIHSDTDYGFVQTFSMKMNSAVKLVDNSGNNIKYDGDKYADIASAIDYISTVISLFCMLHVSEVTNVKKISNDEKKALLKGTSSPKTMNRMTPRNTFVAQQQTNVQTAVSPKVNNTASERLKKLAERKAAEKAAEQRGSSAIGSSSPSRRPAIRSNSPSASRSNSPSASRSNSPSASRLAFQLGSSSPYAIRSSSPTNGSSSQTGSRPASPTNGSASQLGSSSPAGNPLVFSGRKFALGNKSASAPGAI